jgi:hypothetical protein
VHPSGPVIGRPVREPRNHADLERGTGAVTKIILCAAISIFPTVLLLSWMNNSGVLRDLFSFTVFGSHAHDALEIFVCALYCVITIMLFAAVKLCDDDETVGPQR